MQRYLPFVAALVLIIVAAPAPARDRDRDDRREEERRLREARRRVEGGKKFNEFWAKGASWWTERLEAAANVEVQDTPPAAPAKASGEEAEEIAKWIAQFAGSAAERMQARTKLKKIGDAAIAHLAEALTHENGDVRRSAQIVLRQLGPDVAGAVWPLLEHEDRLVRQAAVTLYADKADTAHFGAVYGLHERSEHPEVQRQMRKSMELMLREEPVRLGTWLMKKDDYKVKAWGVAAIAHGGVEALPFLIQSLELPEEPTREDVAHYRLLLRAIGASAAQARERDDIPKLLTAYRRLGRQHQDLVRRPLVHLAHESPEPRLDDFKFFTYVNVFKIRGPDGRWPRDFNY